MPKTSPQPAARCAVTPRDLRCDQTDRPLAIDGDRPTLSWSLERSADAEATAGQSAWQVQIFDHPTADGEAIWDSGQQTGSERRHAAGGESAAPAYARRWWRVRVWDTAGQASDWSTPAAFEVGPGGRDGFTGRWIGPSVNLMSDPLPTLGPWIAPRRSAGATAGEQQVVGRFDLPDGYPRCFGMAWVAADVACHVLLNDEPIPCDGPLGRDLARPVCLPWDKLRKGENRLAIAGPPARLAEGVSVLVRVHEASSGWHLTASGEAWTCDGGGVEVLDLPAPPTAEDNGPRRAVELTQDFELEALPDQARLYLTGLGSYAAEINGRPVGDELLAPGWTDFDHVLDFAAHDVTDLLQTGTNQIRVHLGNGWWSSGMGWQSLARSSRASQPLRLLAELRTADGHGELTPQLVSDARWRWRPSRILRNTLYHGEQVDLHRPEEDWQAVTEVDEPDFAPRLRAAGTPPIRVTQTLEPESVRRVGDGWLFDFGQNHAGRPRLRAQLPAGTRLSLRHCEELDAQGQPYYENYRTAAVTDTVVCGDQPVDFVPRFTYRGYRFVILGGLPEGVEPTVDWLSSQVLHNDVAVASRFACGNDLYNQIDRIVRWGLRSNLHSVPTDCPQRDERLGWTGDVQLFARTSCWLADLQNFYRKWLDDLIGTQMPDGGIMHVAPYCTVLPIEAAPVWADIITVLPRVMHQFYGDREALQRAYPAMRRWVSWFESRADDGLALVGGFGDWVSLEVTPPEFCGAAYYAYSCRLLAETAEVLGLADEAREDHRRAQQAAAAFHRHYYRPEAGRYDPDTQTAQAVPLALGLVPAELRQGVADHLAELVRAKGEKPATGFVGTAFLLPVLSAFGHHDLADRVLNTTDYPSVGYMIDQGGTTVWERWNSDKEGPDMNSRNHFCLGTMAQWLYEDLAGLRTLPDAPGLTRLRLAPRPTASVPWLEFDYHTPQGPLTTRWEVRDGRLVYEFELPPDVTAEVVLPRGGADPDAQAQTYGPGGRHRVEASFTG